MIDEEPTVVCLCGLTRFKDEFIAANFRETRASPPPKHGGIT